MAMPIPDRGRVRALLEEQILGLWGAGRLELIERNYAPDVIDHMAPPGQPPKRDGLYPAVDAFRAAIPDLAMKLHLALVCGDIGVDVWTLGGTHAGPLSGLPPTGKPVEFSGIDMIRVGADGRIAELWHVEELHAFEDQTGLTLAAAQAEVWPEPAADTRLPDAARLSALERRNLATGRRHLEQFWAAGRTELAAELFAPDVVDHQPAPGQSPGIVGLIEAQRALRDAAPDLAMRIETYAVDGAWVVDRWRMRGTHTAAPLFGLPSRGRPFTIAGIDASRIDTDGRVAEVWHCEELHRLRAQLR